MDDLVDLVALLRNRLDESARAGNLLDAVHRQDRRSRTNEAVAFPLIVVEPANIHAEALAKLHRVFRIIAAVACTAELHEVVAISAAELTNLPRGEAFYARLDQVSPKLAGNPGRTFEDLFTIRDELRRIAAHPHALEFARLAGLDRQKRRIGKAARLTDRRCTRIRSTRCLGRRCILPTRKSAEANCFCCSDSHSGKRIAWALATSQYCWIRPLPAHQDGSSARSVIGSPHSKLSGDGRASKLSRCLGARPKPGRMLRTFSAVKSSPAAIGLTA